MQLKRRADHDHRSPRVIDALAKQVLAEAALLTFQHVAQALQTMLTLAGDRSAAPAVVDQRVDSFLQHALLVAYDDLRRIELHEPLEAIITVDHTAIEIVEIRRCEPAAVELDHWTQIRRNHRQDLQNHPLRFVAGLTKGFHDAEALRRLLALLRCGRRALYLLLKLVCQCIEIDSTDKSAHGARAHLGTEST